MLVLLGHSESISDLYPCFWTLGQSFQIDCYIAWNLCACWTWSGSDRFQVISKWNCRWCLSVRTRLSLCAVCRHVGTWQLSWAECCIVVRSCSLGIAEAACWHRCSLVDRPIFWKIGWISVGSFVVEAASVCSARCWYAILLTRLYPGIPASVFWTIISCLLSFGLCYLASLSSFSTLCSLNSMWLKVNMNAFAHSLVQLWISNRDLDCSSWDLSSLLHCSRSCPSRWWTHLDCFRCSWMDLRYWPFSSWPINLLTVNSAFVVQLQYHVYHFSIEIWHFCRYHVWESTISSLTT